MANNAQSPFVDIIVIESATFAVAVRVAVMRVGVVVMKQLFIVFFVSNLLASASGASAKSLQSNTFVETTTETQFIPHRYNRYIFFYFSENVTVEFVSTVLHKLFDFDNFCGGENYGTKIFVANATTTNDYACELCSLEQYIGVVLINIQTLQMFLEFCTAHDVSSGSVDHEDANHLSEKLITETNDITISNKTSQVILITDYIVGSLNSSNTTERLYFLKSKYNIEFIALTSNISDEITKKYFSNEIWTVFPNYTSWTPENTNPICGYISNNYTTPSPSFSSNSTLFIYIFLSAGTDFCSISDVQKLLLQLTKRRWQYPCRQYRSVFFTINKPSHAIFVQEQTTCYADDTFDENSESGTYPVCNEEFFHRTTSIPVYLHDDSPDNITCTKFYSSFFSAFVSEAEREKNKFLLITDFPLMCPDYTGFVILALNKYKDYGTGAPLTIIAIDKEGEKSVANSYKPLFPPTQTPNLYEVNNITELFPNINKTINFCLNAVPWLQLTKARNEKTVWYLYLIGASLLTGLINTLVIFVVWRKGKRQAKLRQIRGQIDTTANIFYQHSEFLEMTDVWEVSLKSINFDNKTFLGKGAFSFVYSVHLRGKAPVLNIFPSIALQQFSDCDVALKTLPQHCKENDKTRFRDEIRLMKEIGYHVHLVSMLGCNISIEIPFVLMELAQQDLLHWLGTCETSEKEESETTLDKTLLSIAWQVSDGMSYLSARKLVHRDLAARNVLLNSDMKAMISDFGLCQKLNDGEQTLTITGGKLPIKWMALESLQEQQFSSKTDVWSFGVLLFEIFSLGLQPYSQISGEELVAFLRDGSRLGKPRLANEEIYDLMKQCWQVDPERRPDFFKIESHFAKVLEESAANYGYLQTTEYKTS